MAQFAKIWTTIFDDEWFLSLSGNQRSIFLQLIILAKRNSDTGTVRTRSVQSLSDECSVSRQTMTRMLAKMQAKWAGSVHRVDNGITVIALPNYKKYQELRTIKSNIGTNNREQSRLDKSRAEQIRKDTTVGRSADADYSKEIFKAQRAEEAPTHLVYFESFPFSKNLTERERYELIGKLIKKCLNRPRAVTQFLHRRCDSLSKIQTQEGFYKYINKPCGDAEFMGECESAAHKHDDGTQRGGVKSIKDVIERNG